MKNYALYITKEKHAHEEIFTAMRNTHYMEFEKRSESTFGQSLQLGDPKDNYFTIVELEKGSCIIFSTPDKIFYDFRIRDVNAAILNISLLDVEYIDVGMMWKHYRVSEATYSYSPYAKEKNFIEDNIDVFSNIKKRGFDKKLSEVSDHILGYNILEIDPETPCVSYNIIPHENWKPERRPSFMRRYNLSTLTYKAYSGYIERDEKELAKATKKKKARKAPPKEAPVKDVHYEKHQEQLRNNVSEEPIEPPKKKSFLDRLFGK